MTTTAPSRVEQIATALAGLPAEQKRAAVAEVLADLSDAECLHLLHDWAFWARQNQMEPAGAWLTWLFLAGRGTGKTRSGAEFIRKRVESGVARRIALVGPTVADVRDVMVEGPSGILAVFPPDRKPLYEPSKRRVSFHNGAVATTYSADKPERLRGPEHDTAWCDEPASWRFGVVAWDNLQFGMRVGDNPQNMITGTPKPVKLIRQLVRDPTVHITRGSTYENVANLAAPFVARIIRKYEGTRLGRQEIYAELLEDIPGALWNRGMFDRDGFRVSAVPPMKRIVVGVDPSTADPTDDEADDDDGDPSKDLAACGILVAGRGVDDHGYVLADATMRGSPYEWATQAVGMLKRYGADRIVAEVNNGGAMVEVTIRVIDKHVPYKAVWASRGKQARAEPISALYERHLIHHVVPGWREGFTTTDTGLAVPWENPFEDLEDQLVTWVPNTGQESPDRLDALVWAFTELFIEPEEIDAVVEYEDHVSISPY